MRDLQTFSRDSQDDCREKLDGLPCANVKNPSTMRSVLYFGAVSPRPMQFLPRTVEVCVFVRGFLVDCIPFRVCRLRASLWHS
jgi:hypothetical protein